MEDKLKLDISDDLETGCKQYKKRELQTIFKQTWGSCSKHGVHGMILSFMENVSDGASSV